MFLPLCVRSYVREFWGTIPSIQVGITTILTDENLGDKVIWTKSHIALSLHFWIPQLCRKALLESKVKGGLAQMKCMLNVLREIRNVLYRPGRQRKLERWPSYLETGSFPILLQCHPGLQVHSPKNFCTGSWKPPAIHKNKTVNSVNWKRETLSTTGAQRQTADTSSPSIWTIDHGGMSNGKPFMYDTGITSIIFFKVERGS